MATKQRLFLRAIQLLLQLRRLDKSWLQSLLALMTALVCIVGSPVLAKAPVHFAAPNLPSSSAQTQNLVQQGKILYDAGQFAQAVKLLQQAAEDFNGSGDRLSQAMALSNLSLTFEQLGQWDKAEDAIAQSLNILQSKQNKERDRSLLAQSLDVQGKLQLARGQAQVALTTWQQAANIYTQIGDRSGLTRNRINQAQAMQALGLYRQAQKTLTGSAIKVMMLE